MTTTKKKSRIVFAGALCAGLGMITCGPELSRVSELENLRVLAVQKDKPYAKPGESVGLRMAWEDGASDQPRDVQLFWIGNCQNPPGDFYAGCALRWAEKFAGGTPPSELPEIKLCPGPGATPAGLGGAGGFGGTPGGLGGAPSGFGDTLCTDPNAPDETFTIQAAPLRPQSTDPSQPRSGVAYAFFGLCAGRVDIQGWISRLQEGNIDSFGDALPYCLDENDKPLGGNDYIIGYSTVYSYEGFTNDNPIITGFEVQGKPVDIDCIGSDFDAPVSAAPSCFTEVPGGGVRYEPFELPDPAPTECPKGVACIEACDDNGGPSCPEISIKPIVDRRSAELDGVANATFGSDNEESLWINYFVDRGSLKSDVKLLNDAVTGWNEESEDQFYAPREPGPMRIWAVVHDNRGGVSWIRVPAFVR